MLFFNVVLSSSSCQWRRKLTDRLCRKLFMSQASYSTHVQQHRANIPVDILNNVRDVHGSKLRRLTFVRGTSSFGSSHISCIGACRRDLSKSHKHQLHHEVVDFILLESIHSIFVGLVGHDFGR